MDTGKGYFRTLNDHDSKVIEQELKAGVTTQLKTFWKGQVIECNGSRFRVHELKRNRLILKLLKDEVQP